MKITKTTTTTYDINIFGKFPHTWGKFREIRERLGMNTSKFKKCVICDKSFEDGDSLYIAAVSTMGNQFVCESCYKKHGKGE
jgi:hypothetical protein